MTRRGLYFLYKRLLETKEVFVFEFNKEQFLQYCKDNFLNVHSGALDIDERCERIVGQYFYID